ncbi:MAG TPA: hypothetical protein VHH73_00270 [Verrucomicrobiae bacterium]|nr:hypothetical protein [Verrucomicrobiae bacterium]
MKTNTSLAAVLLALALFVPRTSHADDWKDKAISPVTNPLFFEDPRIDTEIRPIFMWHNIDKSFLTAGGNVRVYAAQLRYAVNDRLAIIATKDGFIEFNPKSGLAHKDGWGDLGAGLKYAVIDDPAHQFILTPGLKFEAPTGNKRVFQGNGKGEWDVFVSSTKGWDNFHITGSIGTRVPNDMDAETAQMHYSLQLDYFICRWFIPFVSANGFTMLTDGKALPLTTEGYDLINFGSSNVSGRTQVVIGGGFRSRVAEHLYLGFAYERGVTSPHGLFDDRYTVDVIYRF